MKHKLFTFIVLAASWMLAWLLIDIYEHTDKCFMKTDGSVYCYHHNGRLYRLRADSFRITK